MRQLSCKLTALFLLGSLPLYALGNTQKQDITPSTLALHHTPQDCWIAIEKTVYNISTVIESHRQRYRYDLTPWCGKDASGSWKDKDGQGKAHSRKAHLQLKGLEVGTLKPMP